MGDEPIRLDVGLAYFYQPDRQDEKSRWAFLYHEIHKIRTFDGSRRFCCANFSFGAAPRIHTVVTKGAVFSILKLNFQKKYLAAERY